MWRVAMTTTVRQNESQIWLSIHFLQLRNWALKHAGHVIPRLKKKMTLNEKYILPSFLLSESWNYGQGLQSACLFDLVIILPKDLYYQQRIWTWTNNYAYFIWVRLENVGAEITLKTSKYKVIVCLKRTWNLRVIWTFILEGLKDPGTRDILYKSVLKRRIKNSWEWRESEKWWQIFDGWTLHTRLCSVNMVSGTVRSPLTRHEK